MRAKKAIKKKKKKKVETIQNFIQRQKSLSEQCMHWAKRNSVVAREACQLWVCWSVICNPGN